MPNALTIARIALTPAIAVAILGGYYTLALVLFFVAGCSDLADGVLARRYGWRTRLGSLLDPVADKLLFLAVFLSLAVVHRVPLWLALLVIGRDAVIVAGATAYNFLVGRLDGAASWLGKANTAVLGLYVLAVLGNAGTGLPGPAAERALTIAVVASVVASGLHYVVNWSRRARRESKA